MEALPTAIPAPVEARQSPRRPHARLRSRATHHSERAESRKAVAGFWARAEKFSDENSAAARIILADVERHGGEGAGLVLWARRATQRETEKRTAA